jgi:hypothetical protein
MDRLTLILVALAVALLAVLPLLRPGVPSATPHEEAQPSLRSALAEDLRTGKISAEEYAAAEREEEA